MPVSEPGRSLVVRVGREELVVRRRYEALSIANDTLIALWFIAGSIMFFSSAWTTAGTWCFLAGSVELLVRPLIRLTRLVHVRRIRSAGGSATAAQESSMDF
ncbi:YrhK family protein [Nocardiopsis flavescens]|uniref:YrhK-like protein n=1 Tax=Nocardiopsis flavescens TaxID=758803 RepID=A0A1M6LS75_9ACTN|nr:YrhK family protein [Nocardiopsis flavescens]SHJ73952.1 YrhK-like protein [Nocardiopsis flavescens]